MVRHLREGLRILGVSISGSASITLQEWSYIFYFFTPIPFRFNLIDDLLTPASDWQMRGNWRSKMTNSIQVSTHFESLINACNECALACERCASACLQEEDVKMMTSCIGLDIDCAQFCRLAVSYFARGSSMAPLISLSCAEVCKACAYECSKHSHLHCKDCAEACRRCVEELSKITD